MAKKNKSVLDRIDVREPCTESWEEMTGNDEVRFCSHCSKNVFDLSAYTRTRAEKLVRDSNGGICVRYRKDERGRVVTAPPRFTQIKRHAKIAAGVVATTMSVASMAYTQGSPRPIRERAGVEKREKDRDPNALPGLIFSGIVSDPLGAVIPNAEVSIRNSSRNFRRTTRTDENGIYLMDGVESGTYDVEVSSPGFKKYVESELHIEADLFWDVSLEVGELMGVVVVADEPVACDDSPKISDQIEVPKLIDLPLPARTFTMGLFPGVAEKPEEKGPAKKSKKKLPK